MLEASGVYASDQSGLYIHADLVVLGGPKVLVQKTE